MQYLRVKNWGEHQHYKDRNPPWIKLHRALLDDYEFCQLSDESKAHLVLIWLLASQSGGRIPAEPAFLASKIGSRKRPDLNVLVAAGFLIPESPPEQDASKPLAPCKQDASALLAFARSREERREEERQSALARRTAGPSDSHRQLAAKLGVDCLTEWEQFWGRVDAKGKAWFKDADAAFGNWLRQERKYAERDGRVPAPADQPRRVAL